MARIHGAAGEWARVKGTVAGLWPAFLCIFLAGVFSGAIIFGQSVQFGALMLAFTLVGLAFAIMKGLRENPPKEIGGLKVTAVRDYLKGVRTENGKEEPTGLPTSDVLYFELEKGNWVCVRPSGTEPKIKLYVNTNDKDQEVSRALNEKLCEASKALMA